MGRIIAIDYGKKRCGIATTDPLQIIASPHETIQNHNLLNYLDNYLSKEVVDQIVVGLPLKIDNSPTDTTSDVKKLTSLLEKKYPDIKVSNHDERFTTILAKDAMIRGGMKKSDRRVKGNVDKISAAIILQSFLEKKF